MKHFLFHRRQNERSYTQKNDLNENNSRPLLNNQSKAVLKTEKEENSHNFEQTKSVPKTKIILEPDTRKMVAEKPLLLQDLSQSRLLQKFKQELEANSKNKQMTEIGATKTNTETNVNRIEIDENCVYGADLTNVNSKQSFVQSSPDKKSPDIVNDKMTMASTLNDQSDDFEKIYLEKVSKEMNEPVRKKNCTTVSTSPNDTKKPIENEIDTLDFCEIKSNLRKPVFNPLHVILKDKNKYHTTEFI